MCIIIIKVFFVDTKLEQFSIHKLCQPRPLM